MCDCECWCTSTHSHTLHLQLTCMQSLSCLTTLQVGSFLKIHCILITKTTEDALSYCRVRGLYFLAVVFVAAIVLLLVAVYHDDSLLLANQFQEREKQKKIKKISFHVGIC